uniref:G domain-containing protein n=1 Tax=Chromera velia CCMP2878 TaxID=1169474 RepID=A0A0G4I1B1_9ALVE|eukprot:Cvel_10078.t1-p1 / transcript=Cvel_10078.t1 / gene=Cvel_10078 / organism=Chromera_velia_CCMP2878 / gene_product=Mitochondrial GTPase 1, putative / transcript_product=Mitochondrial GTPase 1, putative / location=Cvel_scaffold600:9431-10612(+) / protein_length=394 / sequence_SO=supercontig / SO=protein_coding / is_pseudo=false
MVARLSRLLRHIDYKKKFRNKVVKIEPTSVAEKFLVKRPKADDPFPDFVPRPAFLYDEVATWYPPHMHNSILQIKKVFTQIDAVVEVRDCRAPLTTSQYVLTGMVPNVDTLQRIVILNKADLVQPAVARRALSLLEERGIYAILTDASKKKNVIKIREFLFNSCSVKFRTLGLWLMVLGLPNVGKSSVINSLKELAFAQAARGNKGNKLVHEVKRTKSKAGKEPGLTKEVGAFQISSNPRMYCVDTPGIMFPKLGDPEVSLKLAALGCIPDEKAGQGPMYVGDYVLWQLNRRRLFHYVDILELTEPSDDFKHVTTQVSQIMSFKYGSGVPSNIAGAKFFLNLFRQGHFGRFCLDHLPSAGALQEREQLQDELEPPGPWGPCKYPGQIHGLDDRG